MTNPNTYNTACMTGVIDNVDFTLRDDSTTRDHCSIPPDHTRRHQNHHHPPRLHPRRTPDHPRSHRRRARRPRGGTMSPEKPDALLWMDAETPDWMRTCVRYWRSG
mgnify:CR=1 FL=1